MPDEALRLKIEPPIARLVLCRPDAGNRVDRRFLDELPAAAEAISATTGVVVVVIEAEGADFCLGWEEETRTELIQARAAGDDASVDPFGCLARLAPPVVVALQGGVRSAGLELALACDVRIAADDARFSLPEVEQGILPLAGGSQRLPRVVGPAAAATMLLLGEELDAEAARRCGLVTRVVPRDGLDIETDALVQRLAGRGPLALRYVKEAVQQGLDMTLDQALRFELDLSVILQTTQDRAEGVRAFLEKRPPRFQGS